MQGLLCRGTPAARSRGGPLATRGPIPRGAPLLDRFRPLGGVTPFRDLLAQGRPEPFRRGRESSPLLSLALSVAGLPVLVRLLHPPVLLSSKLGVRGGRGGCEPQSFQRSLSLGLVLLEGQLSLPEGELLIGQEDAAALHFRAEGLAETVQKKKKNEGKRDRALGEKGKRKRTVGGGSAMQHMTAGKEGDVM